MVPAAGGKSRRAGRPGSRSSAGPLRLVYLAGTGRSGSTIFGRLLGEIGGWAFLGEALRYLFHDGMRSRMPRCACGEFVGACPFWHDHDAAVEPEARTRATRTLRLRRLALHRLSARRGPLGDRSVADEMASMLHRVRQSLGARVLVDGSKNPATGFALVGRPDVTLHLLHVVRHPGGVLNSWSHPKGYLRRHSPLRVLGWWWVTNLFAESLGRQAASYLRVRYEDAVADPAELLAKTVRAVEAPAGAWGPRRFPFLDGARATLAPRHILAGNPDKLRSGTVELRDRGWRLAPVRRAFVDLGAGPLMTRYGYRGRGAARAAG